MVSIHGPLGYEPNTLATAPLRFCSPRRQVRMSANAAPSAPAATVLGALRSAAEATRCSCVVSAVRARSQRFARRALLTHFVGLFAFAFCRAASPPPYGSGFGHSAIVESARRARVSDLLARPVRPAALNLSRPSSCLCRSLPFSSFSHSPPSALFDQFFFCLRRWARGALSFLSR